MNEKICGFVVCRKPEYNSDLIATLQKENNTAFLRYRGIDRMPWEEVDAGFYDGTLPPRVLQLWENIMEFNKGRPGTVLSQDSQVAYELLNYCNTDFEKNELCVIYSKIFESSKGAFDTSLPITWIGYDAVSIGNWSLIAGGVLLSKGFSEEWQFQLNDSCLLEAPNDIDSIVTAYRNWSNIDPAVEELIEQPLGIDAVRIGLVNKL